MDLGLRKLLQPNAFWKMSSFLLHYYEPRRYLKEGDAARALLVLQIAQAIKPDDPQVCLNRARAHAMKKQNKKALRDLTCAVESGRLTAALLETDRYLKPLHEKDGFKALLGRLHPAFP